MWVKAFFHADTGCSIGKDDGEKVFYNVATGQIIVERMKGEAHVASLDQYGNYRLRFFDSNVVEMIENEASPKQEIKLAKDIAPIPTKGNKNGRSGSIVKNAKSA